MGLNANTVVIGDKKFVRSSPQDAADMIKDSVSVVKEVAPAARDIIVKKNSAFHRDMLDDNN